MCAAQIHQEFCYSLRYPKSRCCACQTVCPQQSIDENLLVSAITCDDCGLCSAVCPAEAISLPGLSPQVWQNRSCETMNLLVCSKQEPLSDFKCLGFLDFRLLVGTILTGRVSLAVRNCFCAACRPAVARFLEQQQIWSDQLLAQEKQVQLLWGKRAEGIQIPAKPISRRGFFKAFYGSVFKTAGMIIAEKADERPLQKKAVFASLVTGLPLILGFSALKLADSCSGCGLCVKLCPEKALQIKDLGAKIEILHYPRKCTQCSVCLDSCPVAALSYTPAVNETVVLGPVSLPHCMQCGGIFQPAKSETICMECRFQQKKSCET